MKKLSIFFALLLFTIHNQVAAQAGKSINFNDPNDLSDNFSGSYLFTQSMTGGITGGSIFVPSTAGGEAFLKDTVLIGSGTVTASIDFKFDHALYAAGNQGYNAAEFKFYGESGDPYISFVGGATAIEIHSWSVSIYSSSYINGSELLDNHWYQLKAELKSGPDPGTLYASCYLYDWGTAGTSTPSLVASRVNDVVTNYFSSTNTALLSLYSEQNSGVQNLDNFNISGLKGGGSGTGIAESGRLESKLTIPTVIDPSDNILRINSSNESTVYYQLVAANGSCLKKGEIKDRVDTEINCWDIVSGVYYLHLVSQKEAATKKIIKR